eukprot:SAG31_NODE_1477_length_8194_cov_21.653490_4_plen_166_part_00
MLAYTLKHWAKRRHLNNPSDGTLSSYGLLLLLFHFLQTRSPPLLPNLQQIPPSWPQQPMGHVRLPEVLVPHPDHDRAAAGVTCNTYFYTPADGNLAPLQSGAAQNREHPALLLLEFFRYYAHEFDCEGSVISIRTGGVRRPVTKLLLQEGRLMTQFPSCRQSIEI